MKYDDEGDGGLASKPGLGIRIAEILKEENHSCQQSLDSEKAPRLSLKVS